jgi:mannose-1-phosphate guanylyltransferase
LRLVGDLTLIEQTVERLKSVAVPENIIIITNRDYVPPMRSLLPDIPPENIIGEPAGKDTAPCIAMATAVVSAKSASKNPVMGIFPADHLIKDVEAFAKVINDSADLAEEDEGKIVTIGINPTYPSNGYGYIHCGSRLTSNSDTLFYRGLGFKEKPDPETARKFLADGSYKWNAGMFIWSVSTIMDAFRKFAPDLEAAAGAIKKSLKTGNFIETVEKEYSKLDRISIDYAVMEKITDLVVAECSFPWDDVGSWTALRNQIRPSENNNIVRGLHSGLNTNDCIIVGDNNHLIGTIDVDDMIIVHTEDVTLVCKTHSAQRLKELVKQMSADPKFSRYL